MIKVEKVSIEIPEYVYHHLAQTSNGDECRIILKEMFDKGVIPGVNYTKSHEIGKEWVSNTNNRLSFYSDNHTLPFYDEEDEDDDEEDNNPISVYKMWWTVVISRYTPLIP